MTSIEERYQADMDGLSPKERVARAIAMFNWSREAIARQIIKEEGECDLQRLKWKVALRQYGADPQMRAWIEGLLNRVRD